MYKLESLNEHVDRLDMVDLLENRDKCINAIVETLDDQVSYEEVDQMMVSEFFGLGRLLKGIFVNPFIKRKISKLVDELIKIRVEIAKISLEMDLNDMEDEYDYDEYDEDYSRKSSGRKNVSYGGSDKEDSAIEKKKEALEDSADALEAKMEILAGDDERLEKYVTLQKIEARLKANELIIKMADSSQKKIIAKFSKKVGQEAKSIADDLMECYNRYPSEGAQGLNEKKFDATPETVASRNKVQDLHNKESELLSKARELETKGEEVKASVARLTAKQMDIKADLELISMRIKKLKKRL